MSTQSGITASEHLLDTIKSSQPNDGFVILTAKISADNSKVELFKSNFQGLEDLKSQIGTEPLYILIKDVKKSSQKFDFLSFIPDETQIRLKMLYASTKNTLIRQIGSNSINKQNLITEVNEIDGILNEKFDEQSKLQVMTEAEKLNLEINEQQRQMKLDNKFKGHQLVSQTGGASTTLSFNVNLNSNFISILNETNFISFNIDMKSEQVQILKKEVINSPNNIKILNATPTYNIYKNGELIYFIYSCPSGSKVKERMIYASNKQGFINYLKNNENIDFTNIIEIGDPDELEISLISNSTKDDIAKEKSQSSINENQLFNQKFNKPKGPMRRRK